MKNLFDILVHEGFPRLLLVKAFLMRGYPVDFIIVFLLLCTGL